MAPTSDKRDSVNFGNHSPAEFRSHLTCPLQEFAFKLFPSLYLGNETPQADSAVYVYSGHAASRKVSTLSSQSRVSIAVASQPMRDSKLKYTSVALPVMVLWAIST